MAGLEDQLQRPNVFGKMLPQHEELENRLAA